MFAILGITYGIIIFIVLFGNNEGEILEKQKQEWKKIIGREYY